MRNNTIIRRMKQVLPYRVWIPSISSSFRSKPGLYVVYQGYMNAFLTLEWSRPSECPDQIGNEWIK